ncbi:MAG: stage IV sporulation protein A [Clostridia bacterium]|nr:stage IV sporulation protein A [Clostridia bacterium]
MKSKSIYQDMVARTKSEIYIGVFGPVRSGKSSFIKKFMDTLVIPNMEDSALIERTVDELPQSSAGRTIMTTEPKFIPEQAIKIKLEDASVFNVRMIDCVGFIMPSAIGYIEENEPRMVKTPWFEEPIPFNMAAEMGTQKVITEHSTVGVLITSDGSITDIPRDEYEEAEERAVKEVNATGKPYVIILNCVYPNTDSAKKLAKELSEKYQVPVIPLNCIDMDESEIKEIIKTLLYMFPVNEVHFNMPKWVLSLDNSHTLKSSLVNLIRDNMYINKVKEINNMLNSVSQNEYIEEVRVNELDLGSGTADVKVILKPDLFYKVLGERIGLDIKTESALYDYLVDMADIKKKYQKIEAALKCVEETGYGIVMPEMSDLTLEDPVVIKQNSKYGIKLRANAPSVHMMKANICTEITPLVGSEEQSEELIAYLMNEFSEDPVKIWSSNLFGKSINELVNEGIHAKLSKMPEDAREKVRETIERVINDGCSGLVCIIL